MDAVYTQLVQLYDCSQYITSGQGQCSSFTTRISTVLAVIAVTLMLIKIKFSALSGEKQFDLASRTLRRRLKITRRDGFLLSSETSPIQARFGASYVILQVEFFEAAVRLSMLREDFDLDNIDGLCGALFGTPQYRCLCDWLLELSCSLLDPSIAQSTLKQSDFNYFVKSPSPGGDRIQFSMSVKSWFRPRCEVDSIHLPSMSQEERFSYFKARLCPLQALRAEDGWLFHEMQAQAQRFMDDISICCIHRFQTLISEPEGNSLIEQPTVSDFAFLERGVGFTTPEIVEEFCSKSSNANIGLTLDVQSPVSPMLAKQQFSPNKVSRLMSDYDVAEGDFVVLNLDGEQSSTRINEGADACISEKRPGCLNFVKYTAPTRQDHPLVGAVRVNLDEIRTALENLYPSEAIDHPSGVRNWPRRQRSFQEKKTPWFMQSSTGTEKKKRHRRASECLGRKTDEEFSELCASQFIARVPSSELGCPSNLGLNSPRALNISKETDVLSAKICNHNVGATADSLKLFNEITKCVSDKQNKKRELSETVITIAMEPAPEPVVTENRRFLDETNGNPSCHLFSPSLAPVAASSCLSPGPDMPAELSLNETDVRLEGQCPRSESCEINSVSVMDKRLLDGTVEEELYLNQLYQKSQDLDQDFQREVLSVVSSHEVKEGIDGHHRDLRTIDAQASGTIARLGSAAVTIHHFLCHFSDGSIGPVEVHCAPPKSITRMREKLQEYALPHPRARFPLCANILDPVRATIVCSGPKQMLEVLSWFTKSSQSNLSSGTGRLQACRVKNKFAWPAEALPDGYRDLQVFSLLESGDGQRIIGEIQIHDSELHKLKTKMHKLYVVTRSLEPDFLQLHVGPS